MDVQAGQMRASAAAAGGVDDTVELPATLTADRAKALAEASVARRWAERDRLVLRLPPDRLATTPGSLVLVNEAQWRIDQVGIEELIVRLELSRVWDSVATAPADAGSHLPAPDLVAVPTNLVVLDLPDLGFGRHDVPTLQVAACQAGASWQRVPIEVTSGGDVFTVASAVGEAVIGTALNSLGDGTSVDVELADHDHWLESRDEAALANGANLAVIGNELVQFASAVPLGPKRFRLSGLLRGCRGSEWAMGSHVAGESFVLIESGTLQEIVLPPSALGTPVSLKARGLADDGATPVERVVGGEAMRPPAPVDLQAVVGEDGSVELSWTRRSRLGWMWPEGTEVPLGESVERYRLTVQSSAGTLTFEAVEPRLSISAENLVGMTGTLAIEVVQIGDFAQSRPASTSVTLA